MLAPIGRGRGCARALGALAILLVAVAVALIGPWASPAAAHATLLETTPTNDALVERAPTEVRLRFDEGVDTFDGSIRVFDSGGDRVDRGRVRELEGGALLVAAVDARRQGTYTVAWRVVGSDGHDRSGSYVFHLGTRTGAVEIDDGTDRLVGVLDFVARWAALAGGLVMVGSAVLAAAATRGDAARARLRRLTFAAGAAGAVAVAVLLVTQTASATGRSLTDALGLTWDLATGTRTGTLTLARLVALAAGAALAWWGWCWRRAPWASAVAGAAAFAATSASGHAWIAERRALAVAADVAHLGATAVWIGGLVALAAVLGVVEDRRALLGRFSASALVAAVVVVASGAVSGFEQVGSVAALTGTGYGRLLFAKVAGFAVLVWLGWVNRFRLLPALDRTATALARNVRAEIGIAAAVLTVTAVLVGQAPARVSYSRPYAATEAVADLTVQMNVDPARVGSNLIHLYFFDGSGVAAEQVDAVEVTAATSTIPPRRLAVTPVTPSHVTLYDAALTAPGTWRLEVTAVRAGTPTTVTFEVPIR